VARRNPLVTQHLENVSANLLTAWSDLIVAHTKNRQGIYALYRKRRLYYVGLASDLAWRLKTHRRDQLKGLWDRFSVYLTIHEEHMRELEALLLRISKPAGNKVSGKFARSQDLKPALRRQYRAQTKSDEADLFGLRNPSQRERPSKTLTGRSKATGRMPTLRPFVNRWFKIKAHVKGKTYWARVRQDGTIGFRGKVYNSPSVAGRAATRRSTNGWTFWKFERSPGDWVPLQELRRNLPRR
jgi:hypothetical protein